MQKQKFKWAGKTDKLISNLYPPQVACNPFYRKIYSKVYEKNGNYIILVLGKPGSGKSYTALKMAYDLQRKQDNSPSFNPYTNIFFNFESFLNGVERSNNRGECFILDESGIIEGIQSRNFMSTGNKIASSLFQTMRVKGQVIFVIAPAGLMIDKQVKFTVHADIIMQDHNKQHSWGAVKLHDDDLWNAEFYRKYMVSKIDGERVQWRTAFFEKPPDFLIEAYEYMQKTAKAKMLVSYSDKLRTKDLPKADKYVDFVDALAHVQGNPDDFINKRGKVDPSMIISHFTGNGKTIGYNEATSIAAAVNRELKGLSE